MDEIVIRRANEQDLEALCKLYTEFHEFHVHGVPDRLQISRSSDRSELYLTLEKIINNNDAVIFVAEVEGQKVGLAEVYIKHDEPNPLKISYTYGYLQSMLVSEAYRRKGIGTQLLEAAEQWAKGKNATEMRLDTWEFEEGPLQFYEKYEYQTLRRTLVRKF